MEKHWKIETAACMLGEPVERTRRRIDEKELPLVIRAGEHFVPKHNVLGLRDRLKRENSASLPKETSEESDAQRRTAAGRYAGDGQWEFSARTVAEALENASSEMGISKEHLVYEIRDSGLLHMLGLDSAMATIAIYADKSQPSASPPADNVGITVPCSQSTNVEEKSAKELGQEESDDHFYSLGQAAMVLQTTHDHVKALASKGELRGEVIGSWLWFPARGFQEFVTRVYGKERLDRAPTPYPAARVHQPVSSTVRNDNSASTRPRKIRPQAKEGDSTGIERTEKSAGQSSFESSRTNEPAAEEYLPIPDAARELGESAAQVRARVGSRELEAKQIRGKVMIRRQSIVTLKQRAHTMSYKGPEVKETKAGPARSDSQRMNPRLEDVARDQYNAVNDGERTDELNKSPHQPTIAQDQMQLVRDELAKLRTQLAAEEKYRSNSEQSVRDLRRELEESRAREQRALERLSDTQQELAKEKEKIGLPEMKGRLLSSIRRRLS